MSQHEAPLHFDRARIKELELDPADAGDALSAAIEQLVQSLLRVALRKGDQLKLNGNAVLIAVLEVAARMVVALPAVDRGTAAIGVGVQLASIIQAREAGLGPGPLDVPSFGGPVQ